MARTYRSIPNYTFLDPEHTEEEREDFLEKRRAYYEKERPELTSWEQAHQALTDTRGAFPKDTFYEGRPVRDKDNHGCTYSRPRHFHKRQNKKARRRTQQRLRKMVNEGCTAEDFEAMKPLPVPKQFTGWFW